MARQLKLTIFTLGGHTAPLCFSTDSVWVEESFGTNSIKASVHSFAEGPGLTSEKRYEVAESIDEILAQANAGSTSMLLANVLRIEGIGPTSCRGLFPVNSTTMGQSPGNPIKAYVQFRGVKFYTKENYYQLLSQANASGNSPTPYTQLQSDFSQIDNTKADFIKNKPTKLSDFSNDISAIKKGTNDLAGDVVSLVNGSLSVNGEAAANEIFSVWIGDQVFRIMYENVDDGQGGTYKKLTEIGFGDIAGGGNNVFLSVDDSRNSITLNAAELNLWGKLLLNGLDILGLRYKTVSAATYSPTMEDKGMMIYFTSASPITLTVPKDVLQSDFTCGFVQHGSGLITVAAASGVTITNADTLSKSKGKGSVFSLLGTPTKNTFYTVGTMQ